jgi:PAS domain S-box-containing protein
MNSASNPMNFRNPFSQNNSSAFGSISQYNPYSNTGYGNSAMFGAYGNQGFMQSNSLIANFAFLLLVIFGFIILLRIGISALVYFMKPPDSPHLIDGMVSGDQMIIFEQDPSNNNAKTIYRSINANDGIEFTWSTWVFIDGIVTDSTTTPQYRHIFSKGNYTFGSNGMMEPNNAPGLYLSPNKNELVVVMNTYQVINEEIRQLISQLQSEENRLLEKRTTSAIATTKNIITAIILSSILAVGLVSLAGFILYKDVQKRSRIEEKLRTSEAQFSGIVDLAQDAIISFNQEREIILFNRGAEHLFGYFAEEIIRQPFEILLPEDYQAIYHQYMADFADSTKTTHRTGKDWGEIQGIRKNGAEFPAEASLSKLEVNDQQIFTVILRDISQKKQAERVLEETNKKLSGWVGELERYNEDLKLLSIIMPNRI